MRYSSATPVQLDAVDRKILVILSRDARVPVTKIAREVRVSREVCAYRVRRLEQNRVITGYAPQMNTDSALGEVYYVFFVLDERNAQAEHPKLIAALRAHPATLAVSEYGDTWDFSWKLYAEDVRQLDLIVEHVRTEFQSVIISSSSLLVVRHFVDRFLPQPAGRSDEFPLGPRPWSVDETDSRLLHALQKNARASAIELGVACGISADAIPARLKALERRLIIRGTGAMIDQATLGLNWYTLVVRFSHFSATDASLLTEFARSHTHVMRCVRTYGAWDILMHLVAPSQKEYLVTMRELKSLFAHSIRHYETWVLASDHCYSTLCPAMLVNSE